MKVKRHKKFQKTISFFVKNFGFQEPYRVLIDGTFANAALAGKVNMREQFPKYFDGEVTLLTSPCALIETEKLGPPLYGAVQVLKGLTLTKCQHLDTPIPASECLKSLTGKPKRKFKSKQEEPDKNFVVATQDAHLRHHFRQMIGVPLLCLYGCAPTLEKPSDVTVKWVEKRDKKKLEATGYQKEILQHIKQEILPSNDGPVKKGTRKRKRAGPNPLSCKKSKKSSAESTQTQVQAGNQSKAGTKKRKRIKLRIPKHVKELTSNK